MKETAMLLLYIIRKMDLIIIKFNSSTYVKHDDDDDERCKGELPRPKTFNYDRPPTCA